MELLTQIVWFSAAAIWTSLMLPQVIKSIKTKKIDDLSFAMIILYFLNCALWLAYWILLNAVPMILCNFLALIISIIQLILKIKYSK